MEDAPGAPAAASPSAGEPSGQAAPPAPEPPAAETPRPAFSFLSWIRGDSARESRPEDDAPPPKRE
jgi:hypothetical protein